MFDAAANAASGAVKFSLCILRLSVKIGSELCLLFYFCFFGYFAADLPF
jgi:hypothetical protein